MSARTCLLVARARLHRAAVAAALTAAVMMSGCAAVGVAESNATGGMFIEKGGKLRGMTAIPLQNFTVSFAQSDGKSASTKSIWNPAGATAGLGITAEGLDGALMQRITDEAYSDLVSKLRAAGYTVEESVDISAAPDWAKQGAMQQRKTSPQENCSHYGPFGNVRDLTYAPSGRQLVCYAGQYADSYAAHEAGTAPLNVNYLLHFAYLAAGATKTENKFMNTVSNKANVTLYEGMQIYWRSGAEYWYSKKNKAEVKINEHIHVAEPVGRIRNAGGGYEFIDRKKQNLVLEVDRQKYYTDAMSVLTRANSKLVDAMTALR